MLARALLAAAAPLLLSAGSPLAAQESPGEGWAKMGENRTGTVIWMSFASMRTREAEEIIRPFPVRQFWVKMDHSADRSVRERDTMLYASINCADRDYALLQSVMHDSSGGVLASKEEPDADFSYKPIMPGSLMEELADWACK